MRVKEFRVSFTQTVSPVQFESEKFGLDCIFTPTREKERRVENLVMYSNKLYEKVISAVKGQIKDKSNRPKR